MTSRILLILAALWIGQAMAAGKIYTWTDEDGVVHYGDRPPKEVNAEEVSIQGRKAAPVEVEKAQLAGTWFGRDQEGGEVRMRLEDNGAIRYTQTFPDETIYHYQGIWSLEDRTLSVITEFIEEGGGGALNRSVEPVQLTYTFTQFNSDQLTIISQGETYTLNKVQ